MEARLTVSDSRTGGRGARLEDLAKEAGVSISTVSRALNDSPAVSRRTKQRIWKLAREQDYPFRRNMPAGPIGADATIAVVVPLPQARDSHVSDPFFFELLAGIAEAARERDCDLLVSHLSPRRSEDLDYAMNTSRASGVIFIGQSSLHHAFNTLMKQDHRFVVWGAAMPDQAYCSIGSDNEVGGRRATAHLLRLGRKRPIFLGDVEAPEAAQRYRGFVGALGAQGIAEDPDQQADCHFDIQSAEAVITARLNQGRAFDAVVAASDLIAIGAIRALTKAGLSVPADVSVVGYDNIPASRLVTPPLTTVDQDAMLAGRTLVSKLLDANGGRPTSERVQTSLVIRESCGA